MQNKSFTLIELLVVIAIIGLMAAVVLVSMGGIQSKAKITKSLEFSQSIQRSLGAYAVGIWSFDDQANPTKDGSGYGNDGTINGATYTDETPHKAIDRGDGKYALSFDGTNDFVNVGNNASLDIGKLLTIEMWIKTSAGQQGIIRKSTGVGMQLQYELFIAGFPAGDSGLLIFRRYCSCGDGGYGTLKSASKVNDGKWHHITAVEDNAKRYIYIDGVLSNSISITNNPLRNNAAVNIGIAYGVGQYFNGLIDEVRIYGKALTFGQIKKLYSEGLENHQNLVIK